ncbi:DUF2834 domain-containing protein [Naasia lichenicola]|uniref:DUF2834 domain-containing protein n=1 Tax=Naasia lichenicola TaxID=2565933 RepID=A0A4S4FUR9_9MICO|nr:DUF2834 domain-containing protein [Naasia lichenicola]THG33366.1 DUF2834 domain-containing protein [Naasia lichenicola]
MSNSWKQHWSPAAVVFLVLSIIGLVGTWSFNALAIVQMRDFVGDWVNSGPSVSSLTVDLLVAAVAGSAFIVLEARRLGMRHAWLYIVLSGVTAFACMFPLFLAMRQRRITALAAPGHGEAAQGVAAQGVAALSDPE